MKKIETIHLNLKREWFDMIASGVKKEEYRDVNDYWTKRIGKFYIKSITPSTITFSNGYAKERKQMIVELLSVDMDVGREEWGANGRMQFVLKLGKILKKNF